MEIKIDFKNRTVHVLGNDIYPSMLQQILHETISKYFPEQNVGHTASEMRMMEGRDEKG